MYCIFTDDGILKECIARRLHNEVEVPFRHLLDGVVKSNPDISVVELRAFSEWVAGSLTMDVTTKIIKRSGLLQVVLKRL